MTKEEQFAFDYNCSVEDFQNNDTLVTLRKQQEGTRKFEEDERIDEAFLFEDYIEDVLGVQKLSDTDEVVAVAGATANSDRMWELGVNSFTEGKGYGQAALCALVKEVQKRGKVPYCKKHLTKQPL